MSRRSLSREATGIVIAVLFLGLGVLVIWTMQKMDVTIGDVLLVSLLFLPILIFLILTGRISALSGPGGLQASFVDMAQQPATQMVSSSEDLIAGELSVIPKGTPQELQALETRLEKSKRILLKIEMGEHYELDHLKTYLERLLRYQNFNFVIFQDRQDRVVAYTPGWAMFRILLGNQAERFVEIITSAQFTDLWDFPGVRRDFLSAKEDNLEALREMADRNLTAMVLVNKDGSQAGVVEREKILSKLFLEMAENRN